MEPCGTPVGTDDVADFYSSITTVSCLFSRYDEIHSLNRNIVRTETASIRISFRVMALLWLLIIPKYHIFLNHKLFKSLKNCMGKMIIKFLYPRLVKKSKFMQFRISPRINKTSNRCSAVKKSNGSTKLR